MAEIAAPNAGDIPITLDGEKHVLKPSLEACIGVSKIAGGLSQAVARCHQLNFETVCEVIGYGLNATSGPQRKQVEALVYKTGVIAVAAEAIAFIRTIANGGQRPTEEGDGEGEGPLPEGDLSQSGTSTTAS